MSALHGFERLKSQKIEELNTQATLYRHLKTGAELLSLDNDDTNKVFGVAFRTPPTDSKGVPHIMEHTVLGGSKNYPLKMPFIQLVKGSLKTFLNAFTLPDRTVYPVASENVQDFYNLISVYLDAVFYPLLTPNHLKQEGWHYELERLDDPLVFKGVVFNEMKGGYSSPESRLSRASQTALFPDNAYAFDAGGDPEHIPDLDYEQFKAFHTRFYHPSNARVFFYGDDDPHERLRLMDVCFSAFARKTVDSGVRAHRPFSVPRRSSVPYGVEDEAGKSYVQLTWALPETFDPQRLMALDVLGHALIATPASPLRKALLDSGLGSDLSGGGMSHFLRQTTFQVGLKGVAEKDEEAVEALILDTLGQLAQDGFDPQLVEAALNTVEFGLRENNTGNFPQGLWLFIRALNVWDYDADPFKVLAFEAPLVSLKQALAADAHHLDKLIQTQLLDNSHRVTLTLKPDPELNTRQRAREERRLKQAKEQLDEAQLQQIMTDSQALKRLQATPDSAEALATLPRLNVADLDRRVKTLPGEVLSLQDTTLLYHDVFTNGIAYLDVGFDLHVLPPDLLPLVELFGKALVGMGTRTQDYVQLSQRIGRQTGGIEPETFLSATPHDPNGTAWLFLRGKAMVPQAQALFDILKDVLLELNLDDRARFTQLVKETLAAREAGLVPGGAAVVNVRLRSHFSRADWAKEQLSGVSNLLFLRQLLQQIETDWTSVLERLQRLRGLLVNRRAMVFNLTLDRAHWQTLQARFNAFVGTLPSAARQEAAWEPDLSVQHEGLSIPAQVNYVGKGYDLYGLGYTLHGSVAVITNYLRTTYLWDKVRIQGGAYGGFCLFDRHSGVFDYLSYRDPNLLDTLKTYDHTGEHLRQLTLSREELTQNIVGAVGALDPYLLPDAKGFTAMTRHLLGLMDEARQHFLDEVISTTKADFEAFADVLEGTASQGCVVVLGSSQAIEAANEEHGGWLRVQKVLS